VVLERIPDMDDFEPFRACGSSQDGLRNFSLTTTATSP
jgi:hypothetical protein